MQIRNRIIGHRLVKASELAPHPKNWRTHPDSQRNVLRGLLAELGYLAPIITRQLDDNRLQVIDGHLRAEELGDSEVTVVVTDLTEEEARKALATIDPVSDLAGKDQALVDDLLAGVETDSDAVQAMLDRMLSKEAKLEDEPQAPQPDEKWIVVVECASEAEQVVLIQQFQQQGLNCRALVS